MASKFEVSGARGIRWRRVAWGVAAFILLLPFLAMQVTSEVKWDETDFIVFGAMIAIAGGAFELVVRVAGSRTARAGAAVAIAASFLLVWVNLAVGFLGDEDNPANLMFLGVIAVWVAGAIVTRFRPAGMARTMFATAAAQLLVGVAALAFGLGSLGGAGIYEAVMGTTLFGSLWLLSAGLFGKAARG